MHKLHIRRKEFQMEAKFLISGDTSISVQMGDEISLEGARVNAGSDKETH